MLKSMAVQNDCTLKPAIKWSHKRIRNAFITNRNNPSERTVTGRVNRISIGLMKTLRKLNITATVSAVLNSSTVTPFITWEISRTNKEVIKRRRISFIYLVDY